MINIEFKLIRKELKLIKELEIIFYHYLQNVNNIQINNENVDHALRILFLENFLVRMDIPLGIA